MLMQKKWLWIGISCVGAGLLFGVLLVVGSGGGEGKPDEGVKKQVVVEEVIKPILSGRGDDVEARKGSIVFPMKKGSYEDLELNYEGLKGSPSSGKMSCEKVEVTVVLKGGQLLLITADEAQIYFSQGKPSRGDFEGNVKLSMLKKAKGIKLSKSLSASNPALQFQGFFDNIHFDLEVNLLSSEGNVRFESRIGKFEGEGLELAYNNKEERVEKFEIKRGKVLRFSKSAIAKEREGGEEDAKLVGSGEDEKAGADVETDSGKGRVTKYLFSLVKGITFDRAYEEDGNREEMKFVGGDRLDALFTSLLFEGEKKGGAEEDKREVDTDGVAVRQGNDLPGDVEFVDVGGVLFTPSDADFVMQWRGNMRVVPLEAREGIEREELLRPFGSKQLLDDRDMLLVLGGKAAEMRVDRNGEKSFLKARRFVFQKGMGEIGAYGSAGVPLFYVGGGSTFTGQGFWYRRDAGEARVIGPSVMRMRGMLGDTVMANAGVSAETKGRLAKMGKVLGADPVTVVFKEWLDVQFYNKADVGGNEQLVKQLTFEGPFGFDHALFGLESSEGLVADFEKVVEADDTFRSRLMKMAAAGDIKGRYAVGDRKTAFSAHKRLLVDFNHGVEGKMTPKTLLAVKNVTFGLGVEDVLNEDTEGNDVDLLEANGELFVEFEDAEFAGWDKGDEKSELTRETQADLVPVKSIKADGGVMLVRGQFRKGGVSGEDRISEKMSVVADHLVGDMRKQAFQFWGTEEMMAQIVSPGFKLQGDQITVKHKQQWVDVLGKGMLTYSKVDDKQNNEATVTWSKMMQLDNLRGRGVFSGDVESRYQQGEFKRSAMGGNRMELKFDPIVEQKQEEEEASFAMNHFYKTLRELKLVHGDFEVVELQKNYRKLHAEHPMRYLSKIKGKGKYIIFRNSGEGIALADRKEEIEISGKGSEFSVLDNKLAEFKHSETKDHITMQGAGLTKFDFDGELVVDVLKNVVTMIDKVVMHHAPLKKEGQRMRMSGHKLTANIADVGGIQGLMSQWGKKGQDKRQKGEERFELKDVTLESADVLWVNVKDEADKRLMIRTQNASQSEGRLIIADRLYFDADKNTIKVTPKQNGKMLQFDDPLGESIPKEVSGYILWTLGRNNIEIRGLGGGSIEIER